MALSDRARKISDVLAAFPDGHPGNASNQAMREAVLSLDETKGLINPNPGAQRLIGLPATAGFDPSIDKVLGQPLCATATVTSQVKTTNQVDYAINGQVFRKAATDNFWTLTGGVVAISSWQKWLLLVDSSGAATVLIGTASTVSAAAVTLPALPPNKAVFGVLTVATDASHTFTPGTTLLGAAGITSSFVDGLDPLYASNTTTFVPTVTVGTNVSTIASNVLVPATASVNAVFVPNPNAPFTYLGCQIGVSGQGFPDQQYVGPVNVAGLNPSGGMVVEFETDGSQFEFWMKGTASKFRVMVDGQYVSQAASAALANDGNSKLILVAFGARANRRIRIEMSSSVHFGGIRVGPNDSWWASSLPHGPRVIVMGDSFVQGTGADALLSGFHDTMGKLLGWFDVWSSGQGGTGYLNPGAFQTFRARVVSDVISQNPDIVLIAGGYNDSPTYTAAQIGAESLLLFQQIRAALPNCKIMVVEQWSANGSPSQTALDVRAAIKASLGTIAGPTLFIDTMVTTVPGANTLGWITGTGNKASPTGSGNADLYVSSDAIHPTQAGHDYYGRRFAQAIAAGMPF